MNERVEQAEEWVIMERWWMVHTWSVVCPSLLNYPHAYPIAAAPYLPVVLVNTKLK